MLKKIKWLPLLFVLLSAFLVGCGDSSQFKKGDKFLEEESKLGKTKGESSIEIISDDKWKYTDEGNGKSAVYDVKETEFKAGKYKVIKVTKSDKHSEQDPWVVKRGRYYLTDIGDNGFSVLQVGFVVNQDTDDWEYLNKGYDKGRDFKKDYEEAKDKEAFLKSVADHAGLKYTKINS
ncbi:DUF5512 family protein [Bacillus toyonensis]|uniref:DUF5512 family protein n=1 Tax=Bacillus toyonensis TaxID=155322 RepID=UPI001C0C2A20|nr:DUF5512 family protein [Bacillus toyonensis]MBU4643044.1 DUF5512 family protein [Bacillus toyonensis]